MIKSELDHRSEQQTETYLGVEKDRIEAGRALASVFPDTRAADSSGGPVASDPTDDLLSDFADLLASGRRQPGRRVA